MYGNVIAASDLADPEENPFLGSYDPLGDIYNNQRVGSFEAEPGFGGFVPESANPRDQQVADEMKHSAGHYGSYEFSGGTPSGGAPEWLVEDTQGVFPSFVGK